MAKHLFLGIKEDRIFLRSFYDANLVSAVKAISGARWAAQSKVWTFPATVAVADALVQALDFFGGAEMDQEFAALADSARAEQAAQDFKRSDNLDGLPGVRTPAWLHQKRAFHYARNLQACMLAMGMGTGKSLVALSLIADSGARRVLVIAPRYVVGVWPREVAKHVIGPFPRVSAPRGTTIERGCAIRYMIENETHGGPGTMIVINYEALNYTPVADAIMSTTWDLVIADEIHRIKAPGGKTSLFFSRLRSHSKRRLGLSGTIMPNSPLDVYAPFRFLDPGLMQKSFMTFKSAYAVCDKFGRPRSFRDQEDLARRMDRITYTVGSEVLDLPDHVHNEIPVELGKKTQKAYQEMRLMMIAQVESGEITAANAAVKMIRLRQITGGWAPFEDGRAERLGEEKQDALQGILDDLESHEKVVVFGQFHNDLDAVHSAAKAAGRESSEISGRVPADKYMKEFVDGPATVLAAQIDAAREGIDLTCSCNAVYYSLGFSPGVFDQSVRRVLRPGQKRRVFFHHLIAANTVDEYVYKALRTKNDVIQSVLRGLTSG